MQIKEEKKQFRAECCEKIERLSLEEVNAKSKRISTAAYTLLKPRPHRMIGAYFSFGKEVVTEALIKRLLASDYLVALPVIPRKLPLVEGKRKYASHMEFRLVEQVEELVPGVFGILEPQQGKLVLPEDLEVMFLPGLAFSRIGERLGRGGGYYDRYLAHLPSGVLKIGLAFSEQITETLPVEEHDLKVDLVITEEEVIHCQAEKTPSWE